MSALRLIAAHVRAFLTLGDDVHTLADAVIALAERLEQLEARIAEFDVAGAEVPE
jgi:ubiquinone biosynthesis protein UbiJ